MSRSRKKNPVVSDYNRKGTTFYKRQAARKIRYYKGIIPNGSYFKKLYCSWNIFDYKRRITNYNESFMFYGKKIEVGWTKEQVKKAYRK